MTAQDMTAKYQDLVKLGSGGFGSIYKVCRRRDGQIFARKEVRFPSTGERIRKFVLDEIRVLSTIRHPNIVAYKETFTDLPREKLHIVMEFCARGDLAGYITKTARAGQKVPLVHIWSIIDQIGLALFRCHHGKNHPQDPAGSYVSMAGENIRVYHRDLKPANIFLTEHGILKLGDFGLCAIMKPHERMRSSFVGTPHYMAPEVTKEELYSEKSESWGLGCIAHELTTLTPTFYVDGENTIQMTRRIQHRAYPRIPIEYGDDLPEVISSCFSLNPDQRPSIKDILDHPYIVESRCHRQLGNSHIRWENEKKREYENSRREEELKKREGELVLRTLNWEKASTEMLKRERTITGKAKEFAARELLTSKRERAVLDDYAKWKKERVVMKGNWEAIRNAEEKNQAVRAKVEKEYETRHNELRKLAESLKARKDTLHQEEMRQREILVSKTADLAEKEANLVATVQQKMEEKRRRSVKSTVRDAMKYARRAEALGRGPRSSLASISMRKNIGRRRVASHRPKLWQSAGPNSTTMQVGDTFYIKNGLNIYPGKGKGKGKSGTSEGGPGGVSKTGGAPGSDPMDVGQSFFDRNA